MRHGEACCAPSTYGAGDVDGSAPPEPITAAEYTLAAVSILGGLEDALCAAAREVPQDRSMKVTLTRDGGRCPAPTSGQLEGWRGQINVDRWFSHTYIG